MKKIIIFIVSVLLFNFTAINTMAFTYGDADGNNVLPIEGMGVNYMQIIDVNGDNIISLEDCAYILQKVLYSSFTMPCEKYTSIESTTDLFNVEISVGNETFIGKLYDNSATKAFIEQLPVTLNMSELNGNEKYYYMDTIYPTNPQKVGYINSGDLMLYGNNCIVLFYEGFNTSYSYTPLAKIDNEEKLKSALGSKGAKVTFRKTNQRSVNNE